ncbi:DUF4405 domain-containing protein [Poriferisphaera sp. WC338]|uniref:DUF4405 domain-containing protein n=1 Tax=Poriferisphaera sp. WC338 TaxID=3425129 RepID=UPI003D81A715
MKRNHLNLIIDALLGVLFFTLLLTGLLIMFILPSGSRTSSVWGWTRHDWGELHFWIAIAMVVLLLAHLTLHWTWFCTVCANILGRKRGQKLGKKKYVAGVLAVMLIAGAISAFMYAANASVIPHRKHSNWNKTNRQQALIGRDLAESATTTNSQQQRLRLGRDIDRDSD